MKTNSPARRTLGSALIAGLATIALALAAAGSAGASAGAVAATPAPLCLVRTSQIFVSDNSAFGNNNGGIIKTDAATGTRSTVSENNAPGGAPFFETPWGITRDTNGDLLVAEQNMAAGVAVPSVIRVDPATGARTLVSSNASAAGPALVNPSSLAVDAAGQIVVVDMGAFGTGAIIRIDPATGVRTLISRNGAPAGGPALNGPMDLAIGPNGTIFVANTFGTNIIRVNPGTGARSMVSANGNPGGGSNFAWPWAMTIDPAGSLLVSDSSAFGGAGGIIRVNPSTGARSVVSNNATGAGPQFSHPGDLIVEACTGTLLVVEAGANGVYRVDPTNGNRTVVTDNTFPGAVAFAWPQGIVATNAVPPVVATPGVDVPTQPIDTNGPFDPKDPGD